LSNRNFTVGSRLDFVFSHRIGTFRYGSSTAIVAQHNGARSNDPRQLRRTDRRLLRRVLNDHFAGSKLQQNEIIARIRSAQLLCDDEALITPSAMTAKFLVSQI